MFPWGIHTHTYGLYAGRTHMCMHTHTHINVAQTNLYLEREVGLYIVRLE